MPLSDLSVWAALTAGVLSFLSPCVLPLVPGYISYMSGLTLDELTHGGKREAMRRAGLASIFFVLGFSAVFTAMGASASYVGQFIDAYREIFNKAAGAVIVLFGLHTTGLLTLKTLYVEKRFQLGGFSPGLAGSFLMGLAFAFGWTPCLGPILTAILALAANQQTVGRGVFLLGVYSLGLGIPFILTGFGVNRFLAFSKKYKKHIRAGEIAAGVLLIVVGVLVFSDKLTYLIRFMPKSLWKFAR